MNGRPSSMDKAAPTALFPAPRTPRRANTLGARCPRTTSMISTSRCMSVSVAPSSRSSSRCRASPMGMGRMISAKEKSIARARLSNRTMAMLPLPASTSERNRGLRAESSAKRFSERPSSSRRRRTLIPTVRRNFDAIGSTVSSGCLLRRSQRRLYAVYCLVNKDVALKC